MAITCPRCRAQYDVTLFAYGHTVRCSCGEIVQWEHGHVEKRTELREGRGDERETRDHNEDSRGIMDRNE